MAFNMTFKNEGDYVVCYINGKEVSRTKKSNTGSSEEEIIDIINDQIKANPEMAGDEPNLEGLEVVGDKYTVPQGGGGAKSFEHIINVTFDATIGKVSFTIETNSDTPFTVSTLYEWFVDNQFICNEQDKFNFLPVVMVAMGSDNTYIDGFSASLTNNIFYFSILYYLSGHLNFQLKTTFDFPITSISDTVKEK